MRAYHLGITHTRPIVAHDEHVQAANESLRSELQHVAATLRPSADTLRLNTRAIPTQRVASAAPSGSGYGMKCALCGDPADRFTCAGCDEAYRELGL